jgi:hypothetical protein
MRRTKLTNCIVPSKKVVDTLVSFQDSERITEVLSKLTKLQQFDFLIQLQGLDIKDQLAVVLQAHKELVSP